MQKVNVVCVGKIKESFFREAVAEYAKRLSRFVAFSVREIAEGKNLEDNFPARRSPPNSKGSTTGARRSLL